MLGVFPALFLTLFIGVGSILDGNEGLLPNQKLPLRTDGCYINDTIDDFTTTISSMFGDSRSGSIISSYPTSWKDEEYSALTKLFSVAYLWQPVITVLSTIIFGLLFSIMINLWRKNGEKGDRHRQPVKSRYLSPHILTMWVKLLGKDRLKDWVEFEDEDEDVQDSKEERKTAE